MSMIKNRKWDSRYLELAKHISTWSKDPSTQIGSVAIGENGQVLSQGYNGFPRGVNDDPEILNDREQKLERVVHAEMNVIYNASFNGISLAGSTLYVYGLPCCHDCAKGVIQVGIKRIVMSKQHQTDRWKESWEKSMKMFREAEVSWEFI